VQESTNKQYTSIIHCARVVIKEVPPPPGGTVRCGFSLQLDIINASWKADILQIVFRDT